MDTAYANEHLICTHYWATVDIFLHKCPWIVKHFCVGDACFSTRWYLFHNEQYKRDKSHFSFLATRYYNIFCPKVLECRFISVYPRQPLLFSPPDVRICMKAVKERYHIDSGSKVIAAHKQCDWSYRGQEKGFTETTEISRSCSIETWLNIVYTKEKKREKVTGNMINGIRWLSVTVNPQ